MLLRALKEANIEKGTRVLMRADLDVALKNGQIIDNFRLQQMLPTIRLILKKGGYLRIIGHIDRPQGRPVLSLSLKIISDYFGRVLKRKVLFIKNPFYEKDFIFLNPSPDILLFENIRFWPGEEKNDVEFAKKLAKWGDIYINESFANSHRKHASMVALAKILPAFAGTQLDKEISILDSVIKNPERPLVTLIGGAKLETKLPIIKNFLKIADKILLGGSIANEFLLKQKYLKSPKIALPADGEGLYGNFKDIGPKTIAHFASLLQGAQTIIWNGPLGVAEISRFARGTKEIARIMISSKAFTVVGGGDTVAILRKYKLLRGFNHVSAGGGAMLEFLAGKKLPALEVLKK